MVVNKKFLCVAFIAFALAIILMACGAHSWEEMVVSLEDEKQMGKEYDDLVKAKDPSVMEPGEDLFVPTTAAEKELYEFYQARAREVVNAIDKEDLDALLPSGYTKESFFEFKMIKSEQVNAFAVPGGYVYFYLPILKNFQSESELMNVLAHEVGHVVLHHSRESIVKQLGASVVIDLLVGGEGMGGIIASLGVNLAMLSNSRENEFAADSMAFYYTNKIGISSAGLGDFFSRGLEFNSEGKCTGDGGSVLAVFSTHPPSCERVEANQKRIEKAGQDFPKDKNYGTGKSFKELVADARL